MPRRTKGRPAARAKEGSWFFAHVRSDVAEVVWPPLHARSGALVALLHQLDRTQWLPSPAIQEAQHRQLVVLAQHAADHSLHFRKRLLDCGLTPTDLLTPSGFRRLGILRRRDLQSAGADLYCNELPKLHAPATESQTSGSTGEPVTVRRTALNRLYWSATTVRDHLWHQDDFSGSFSAIRFGITDHSNGPDWGPPFNVLFQTGRSQGIPLATDIRRQAEWLSEFQPALLLIYPSNLKALASHCQQHNVRLPGLKHIRTIAETLSPEVRDQVKEAFGASIIDTYSSQEFGTIALQCPHSGLYHTMENLIVEVLDDDGQPCAEGKSGRVVITDLHNFATPLIRYDIGDFAEPGNACSCGRGLPVLRRILGRERNLVLKPDGTRHWPLVGFETFRKVAPISQFQFIQHERNLVEARLVTGSTLTRKQEAELREAMQKALDFPFEIQFSYIENMLPRAPGGKFEEFICRAS